MTGNRGRSHLRHSAASGTPCRALSGSRWNQDGEEGCWRRHRHRGCRDGMRTPSSYDTRPRHRYHHRTSSLLAHPYHGWGGWHYSYNNRRGEIGVPRRSGSYAGGRPVSGNSSYRGGATFDRNGRTGGRVVSGSRNSGTSVRNARSRGYTRSSQLREGNNSAYTRPSSTRTNSYRNSNAYNRMNNSGYQNTNRGMNFNRSSSGSSSRYSGGGGYRSGGGAARSVGGGGGARRR